MKKTAIVVCVFLFIGAAQAQDFQKNGLEISAFRNAGNVQVPESSMLNYGINVTYSQYFFKRWTNMSLGVGYRF